MNSQGIGHLLLSGRGGPLRHALAHAAAIRRSCVINRISCAVVADALGLDRDQVLAAKLFLEKSDRVPSPEVCAGVASLDPGLNDEDIAEMFGRSVRWAKMARERREEFCQEAGMPLEFADWVVPGDPTPAEIAVMLPRKRLNWQKKTRN